MMPHYVEIRSLKTGGVIQRIELQDCKIMRSESLVYLASHVSIWRLLPVDFEDQVNFYLILLCFLTF